MNRLETQPCPLSGALPRPKRAPFYYFGTSFAFEVPGSPALPAESAAGAADLAACAAGTRTAGCSFTASMTPPLALGRCVAT